MAAKKRGAKTVAKKSGATRRSTPKGEKRISRYEHSDATDPRTPETGHTPLLGDEQIITLPLDNGWSKSIDVGRLATDESSLIVVDMDPAVDPMLLWAGKRTRREVPVLPLQRNEIVAESRIARIVDRAREAAADQSQPVQRSLFADLEKELREGARDKRVEFYVHDEGWKNKLICGDSLPVMESLLHYEGLRGRVQMIYVDPPYGIKYDANFQQRIDTAENDQKDQADDVVTIKAFRDTWALGVHSYLSYLQERFYLCRELLSESGSIFVQMNVENEHLVRALMDEVFGKANYYASIAFNKTTGFTTKRLSSVYDVLLWYAKDIGQVKYQQLYQRKAIGLEGAGVYNRVQLPSGERRRLTRDELENMDDLPGDWKVYTLSDLSSQGAASEPQPFEFAAQTFYPSPNSHWKAKYPDGMQRLADLNRIEVSGKSLRYVRFYDDFPVSPIANVWLDVGTGSFTEPKVYAVQTNSKVVERCIAMTTAPGDLVFDPTCGSGTTAYAAEKMGRRWIACDTSRVAINIARRRLLSSVLEHYRTTNGLVSGGFVYKTENRVTLKSLAYDQEPEQVALVNRPEVDQTAVRVTGPFEAMTLGRYSVEDWKGYVAGEGEGAGRLQNYITVVARLYRQDAALHESGGLVHAVADTDGRSIGISIGPISGRVTARQIHEAVNDARQAGLDEVHILGWAFEANVNEVRAALEKEHDIEVRLMMIRPDTLADGLKTTKGETLFSPLAEPDVEIEEADDGKVVVRLKGVAVFDRKRRLTEYKPIGSGYVAAWYLDEDYDADCFVDCQMFFDFKKKPAVERTLGIEVEADEWKLRDTSDPFEPGKYTRIAVKVVDVFGNESTIVSDLD
jgi:adenine-specific DNA-methyltransferase